MLVICLVPAAIVIAVITFYFTAFSRPQPFPDGIRGITAFIENVHFQSLEAEMNEQRLHEDPEGILRLPRVKQRWIQRRRLKWLERQVLAMTANVKLYCSAAAWELEQRSQEDGQPNDRERMSALILQSAPQCLLALMLLQWQIKLAKGASYVQPANQALGWPLLWVLDSATRNYADLTDYALTVAQSYGGVHYENLLSVLGA